MTNIAKNLKVIFYHVLVNMSQKTTQQIYDKYINNQCEKATIIILTLCLPLARRLDIL